LPDLEVGQWHTEGWIGALLLGSDINKLNPQAENVKNFITESIVACAELLNHSI
jgi:hypothetical protein